MPPHTWRGPAIDWPGETTLPEHARKRGRDEPDAVALIDGETGAVVTRRDLAARAERLARGLSAKGFYRGDCLCAIMPNCVEWYVAALAAQSLGGTVSGVSPASTPEEVVRQFSRVPAKAVIAAPAFLDLARRAVERNRIPLLFLTNGEAADAIPLDPIDGPGLRPDLQPVFPEDPALFPFSSGTADLPKAVVITHRNLLAGGAQMVHCLGIEPGDRIFGLAPHFHIVGPLAFAASLVAGASVVIVPRFEPHLMFDIIEKHAVTHMPIVPPVLRALATHPAGKDRDYSGLRAVGCAGAAVHPSIHIAAMQRLGRPVVQVYGMTETSGPVTIDDLNHPKPGCVGFSVPLSEVRIVDQQTGAPLGEEEDGEIQVRGPHVMQGYLGLPAETSKTIAANGWLRTGDIGRFDADGRLSITGRLKELIKVHSSQVAPAELEAVIATHPAVADVAVIGRPNSHCGEIPVAYVVWRSMADPFAVMEWANDQMISYKRIRAIETIAAVPRNPTGKIDRRLLSKEDVERTRGEGISAP